MSNFEEISEERTPKMRWHNFGTSTAKSVTETRRLTCSPATALLPLISYRFSTEFFTPKSPDSRLGALCNVYRNHRFGRWFVVRVSWLGREWELGSTLGGFFYTEAAVFLLSYVRAGSFLFIFHKPGDSSP